MNSVLHLIAYLIIVCGAINLVRMSVMLIGSDIYNLNNFRKFRRYNSDYLPKVSIIIPAYNEERTIEHCLASALASNYPQDKLEVIVIDDGSTDRTAQIAQSCIEQAVSKNAQVLCKANGGKASALNAGIQGLATGEIVMCLDADSQLDTQAVRNAVKYFVDGKVMAVSANVKIIPAQGLLNLVQRFEYFICYQMKRSQTVFNIEYIIGGIGSTFRKSFLDKIGYYDGNTVTEDIDLTMKILRHGNKNVRVIYGSDIIVQTQGVLSVRDLIRQRYRWKWGRCQTFLKNRSMFFSWDKKFTKAFSWVYLPYALVGDIAFFLEPIFVVFIVGLLVVYGDAFSLVSAFAVISFYIIMNILSEDTIPLKEKARLLPIAPAMFVLFYILSYVEYVSLIKAIVNLPHLSSSLSRHGQSWHPVVRAKLNDGMSQSVTS